MRYSEPRAQVCSGILAQFEMQSTLALLTLVNAWDLLNNLGMSCQLHYLFLLLLCVYTLYCRQYDIYEAVKMHADILAS